MENKQYTLDAHQHFWYYEPVKHSWINDEMAVIRKDFLPADLAPILHQNNIDGCIAVQADQTEVETDFLLALAKENNFIKGIVGWVDLRATNIEERLAYYAQSSKIQGFRHVLQGEEPFFMLQPAFLNGIAALAKHNFTYDILIFPKHLEAATELVAKFPHQPFVIDHIAKPYIKAGLIDEWAKGIKAIAQCPNVHCKISGMVTEGDYKNWKPTDFTPYMDVVVDAFGINRIMYGSDWPVCQVAASYEATLGIVKDYFKQFTIDEQGLFFGGNASSFYKI
ncbi:amidohydrolase family protein [Parasediminibacterium sp. JCM 36343]|uniref:amidohydrolase family protein n=1 Tax=Parasediminibacterium sp. JCM 36343 TaxID=3374279 RepID=UPI0039785420